MLFILLGTVLAAPPSAPVDSEVEASTAGLWQSYLMHFEPDELDVQARAERPAFSCATGLLPKLKKNWRHFTPQQRARMSAAIAPWKTDWLDPVVDRPARPPSDHAEVSCFTTSRPVGAGRDWEEGVEEVMGGCTIEGVLTTDTCREASDCETDSGVVATCEGYQAGTPGFEPQRIVTEHFSVEWDEANVSEAKAQAWAEALEKSWEVEVEQMGWRPPSKSDQYLVLAYISDMNYQGAFTYADDCEGGYMPYIVAGQGSFSGNSNWFEDMGAHEFSHAIQYAYGTAHEPWFWEATATWIQEYVFPSHDWWSMYVTGYTDAPYIALNASSQDDYDVFLHMYGMSIFNFYLDEKVGGAELIQDLWVAGEAVPGSYYDYWIGDALQSQDIVLEDIFDSFIAANTVMAYESGESYPEVDVQQTVGSLPSTGGNESGDRPQGYGQNFVKISTSTATSAAPDLRVSFAGDPDQDWAVLLVGTSGDEVERVQKLSIASGEGDGVLTDYGNHDSAWLVVSPLTQSARGFSYDWEVQAISADSWEDTGDVDPDQRGVGCGCSSSEQSSRGWWVLVGLCVLRRRRQRWT